MNEQQMAVPLVIASKPVLLACFERRGILFCAEGVVTFRRAG
jgi:hypothetical protein